MIELLVVMAILGILMGLVVPKVGRMMDEAKENKCRNNLRQLQVAVMSHVTDKDGKLPFAMSYEVYDRSTNRYFERRGWIAWNPPSGKAEDLATRWVGADTVKENGMVEDFGIGEKALFGIENGTLYEYMNKSLENYACPFIKKQSGTNQNSMVYRTYAMNGFFRSPVTEGSEPRHISKIGTTEEYETYRPESAKLLLFSEIEPLEGTYTHSGAKPDTANQRHACDKAAPKNPADCCFEPASKAVVATGDSIHAVHRSGTPSVKAAFAVFLDGHIAKVFSLTPKKNNSVWFYNRGLDPADDI